MAAPEINLRLIDKKGKQHEYSFYWSGDCFLDKTSASVLKIDVSPLRALVAELPPTPEFETHRSAWRRDRPEAYAFKVSYADGGVLAPGSV